MEAAADALEFDMSPMVLQALLFPEEEIDEGPRIGDILLQEFLQGDQPGDTLMDRKKGGRVV
jgi:hypothetical protein